MQVGAVHRIHHVFQCVLVITVPAGGAQEVAVGRFVRQFRREGQFGRFFIYGHAEIEEHRAVGLFGRIRTQAFLPHQRATIDRRHVFNRTVTADFHAVIPAGDAIAQVPAHGKPRSAMRTAIFQRVDRAFAVTPHHDLLLQARNADRVIANFPTGQHRIPHAAQPLIEIVLQGLCGGCCVCCHCLLLGVDQKPLTCRNSRNAVSFHGWPLRSNRRR
ncbi:hypothetical protein D3C78_922990 [compost metagenome]